MIDTIISKVANVIYIVAETLFLIGVMLFNSIVFVPLYVGSQLKLQLTKLGRRVWESI